MFNHNSLLKFCRDLKLNPSIFGENESRADGHILGVYNEPVDLGSIPNFPRRELEHVLLIGQMVYNLTSQIVPFNSFNSSTPKGREIYLRNKNIERILPLLTDSMNFCLKLGLERSKCTRELVCCNGRVYEVDPTYIERIQKLDSDISAAERREYQLQESKKWSLEKQVYLE